MENILFNNNKKIALKVRNALIDKGLEINFKKNHNLNNDIRKNLVSKYIKKIIILLNLNSYTNTINRIIEMYIEDAFFGLDYNNFPKIKLIKNYIKTKEIITIKNIHITNTCEPLIIDGNVTISYVPKIGILELSSINKIVYFFAEKLQNQERLTKKLSIALQIILSTRDIAVSINTENKYIKKSGFNITDNILKITFLDGIFKDNEKLRKSFLDII